MTRIPVVRHTKAKPEPGSDPTEAGRGWSGFDSARSSTTSNLRIEHCDLQNFALHHFTLSHQHAHKPCRTYSKHHDNTRVGFMAQTVTQSKPDDALPVAPPHHLSAPPSQHVYWWHFRVADVPLRWRMPQLHRADADRRPVPRYVGNGSSQRNSRVSIQLAAGLSDPGSGVDVALFDGVVAQCPS